MDLFFSYRTVTDISYYNCSAISEEKLSDLHSMRQPLRGFSSMIVGIPMILVYIACLRVMVKLDLIKKACYKIMFVIGHYEIGAVLINGIFMGYITVSGTAFCDAPNTFYVMGCFHSGTWAGSSYLCLYLAFNRIIEILNSRPHVIEFFFSPLRTAIGIVIGIAYFMIYLVYCPPAVYSNESGTIVLNPFGFEMPRNKEVLHMTMIAGNGLFVVITCILCGLFIVILRKKFKKLPCTQNRLQRQIFIQSVLLCTFNFFISAAYVFFLFVGDFIFIPRLSYLTYQYTAGLQALIYLLFNQTILDGVKDDLRISRNLSSDFKTNITQSTRTTQASK